MTEHDSNRRTHSTQLRLSGNPVSDVALDRRAFVKLVGAGLLITVTERDSSGQRRGSRGARNVAARLQIHHDGTISVMTGKVEEGQGSRTQLTQAAAEELRVDVAKIRLVMADTDLVPDDGITAGSRTTPSTVPAVRQGAATARELLAQMAAGHGKWIAVRLVVKDGVITHEATKRGITLRRTRQLQGSYRSISTEYSGRTSRSRPLGEWSIIGTSVSRPNARDLVTGAHHYPSDIARPGMLYGKILRPPSYGATLENVDLSPAEAMHDVTVVHDGAIRRVHGANNVSGRTGSKRRGSNGNLEDGRASFQ